MIAQKTYIGTVGTIIDIDMGEDVSQATGASFSVQRPDGNAATWIASVQDRTFLRHVIEVGDINLAGIYKIQPRLTLGNWFGMGAVAELRVYPLFE